MAVGDNDIDRRKSVHQMVTLRNAVNRRQFVELVALGTAPALAGCLSGESGTGSTDKTKKGGHVKIGFPASPKSLVPYTGSKREGYILASWMYSKLTSLNHKLEVQPDLATKWESNDKVDTWTYTLRKDAKFSRTGKRVMAEDVKATFDAIMDPNYLVQPRGTVGPIKKVSVVSDFVVEIKYTTPFADSPTMMASRFASIMPKNIIDNDIKKAANTDYGSGPFKMVDFEFGDHYTMKKNQKYYKKDKDGTQLPYINKLTMQHIPDAIARLNALSDGRIQLNQTVSQANFSRAKGMSGVEAVSGPSGTMTPVCTPLTLKPFDNPKVRKALKYTMDKKEMTQVALRGMGETAQNHPIGPAYRYHPNPPLQTPFGHEAKPEKAKKLLAEAGYKDELELPTYWYTRGYPWGGKQAQLWQKQCEKAGIKFDIKNVTKDRWFTEIWNSPDKYYQTGWLMKYPTNNMLMLSCHSEGPWNDMKWSNKKFDKLIEKARGITNKEKREQLYRQALKILCVDGGWINPFFVSRLTAKTSSLKNYRQCSTGQDVYMEKTWLDE